MQRVSVGGATMDTFPKDQDGGYVKLRLLSDTAKKPAIRTYTIRKQYDDRLDIDFALHGKDGQGGPAVTWSLTAKRGDQISMGGPGAAKPLPQDADWYFLIGDMTALPAISVNLEALKRDAIGHAVIEVQSEADKQVIACPEGITIHWVINPHPGQGTDLMDQTVRNIPWYEGAGRAYGWSASEFETMKRMRQYLRYERGLGKDELYISSYWKHGLVEDQHKVVKREDAENSA